jgi:hypothetical protein
LRAAMGGRRLARVQVAGDLADALASRTLSLNVTDECVWDGARSSRRTRLQAPSGRPPSLSGEALECIDGNESRAPGHVDGLEQGQHPPVEGGAAHPERRGRLRPRVGESVDIRGVTNGGYCGAEGLGRGRDAWLAPCAAVSVGTPYKRTQTLINIAS